MDWDVLSELLAMTKREFLQELVGIFLRDSRRMMADLRSAYQRADRVEWKQIAHKLRGSCATIGARRMMKLTAEMEELSDEAAATRGGAVLADLEEEFAAVRGALLTEKRRAGAPFVVVEDAAGVTCPQTVAGVSTSASAGLRRRERIPAATTSTPPATVNASGSLRQNSQSRPAANTTDE